MAKGQLFAGRRRVWTQGWVSMCLHVRLFTEPEPGGKRRGPGRGRAPGPSPWGHLILEWSSKEAKDSALEMDFPASCCCEEPERQ